jgi:multicomponent Na+:H+ antiporter subunit D
MNNILIYLVLFPILTGSFLGLLKCKKSLKQRILTIITIFMQSALLAGSFYVLTFVKNSGTIIQNIGNWPDFIGITLKADMYAVAFVLMSICLFTFAMIYQLTESHIEARIFSLLLILEGLIIGIFVSNDLFNIFVLIEVATIVISLLIMYKKDTISTYDGMLYLLVNITAMSLFLFGIGMLYKMTGVIDLTGLKDILSVFPDKKALIVPYGLMLTAVCLKSAVLPLFSWLPHAHATPSAPSAISAVLSGIYVKSGIYLFLRIQNVFSDVFDTYFLFLILGFVTAVAGFMLAVSQKDIKLLLAYSTISQIGMIMMGLSMNSVSAYIGGVYHIVNHAFFKSCLFLTAGIIIDAYKTRNIDSIRGVFKKHPIVAIACVISILGITGAPLLNGSISKYWISYGAKGWAEYALIIINIGTMAIFLKFSTILFGKGPDIKMNISKIRSLPVLILSVMCLLGGILSEPIISFLFNVQMSPNLIDYLEKSLLFFISLGIAYLLYRFVISKVNLYKIASRLELGFNGVCISMGVFLLVMILYIRVFAM